MANKIQINSSRPSSLEQLTNIRVDLGFGQQGDKSGRDCSPCAGTLLPDAPLWHVQVDVAVVQTLLVGRGSYAQLVRVRLDPAERNLSALTNDLAKFTRELQRTLAGHHLQQAFSPDRGGI